jgi:adenosylmethionine-8-amino-7-oxononanoate aminotransferase
VNAKRSSWDRSREKFDREHLWHPYTSIADPLPVYPVVGAAGIHLELADGRKLIDGMSSWWAAIHGYNHPVLNEAVRRQLDRMSHVMFGGITHEPAVALGSRLVEITPEHLTKVFFCDSGSVAVEVAIKMALQYCQAGGGPGRRKILTVRGGYHGDTLAAMSVCDPVTGMHHLFKDVLPRQLFAERPACGYEDTWDESFIADFRRVIEEKSEEIAAVILEPIVQGAGGMRFTSPRYLRRVRELCDEQGVLLILDEIATGFGRSGRLFGCGHADVTPDIMCLGKALTGGYLSLAAVLTTDRVGEVISSRSPGTFMHGPTYMANPLACAAAVASVDLLLSSPWRERVGCIEAQLREELAPCASLNTVADVRTLGAIGVVETRHPVDVGKMQSQFVERGVWVRPFGNLVYLMPPYTIEPGELSKLTTAVNEVVSALDDRK